MCFSLVTVYSIVHKFKSFYIQEYSADITMHMPLYEMCRIYILHLSSSVECIFRKTRANRIVVKQCIVFIADCDAQCNQNFGTHRKIDAKRCFHSCVKWKSVKVSNCRECKVIYCILITTRNAKSHSVTSKIRHASKILLVRCGICIVMDIR